jgi:hypothetical protein
MHVYIRKIDAALTACAQAVVLASAGSAGQVQRKAQHLLSVT